MLGDDRPQRGRRSSSTIPGRSATTSCSRCSGRATIRPRACARATTLGTQYRSGIYTFDAAQRRPRPASRTMYGKRLAAAGHGADHDRDPARRPSFYYAEDYHQQYLGKNPGGYCGLGGTGRQLPDRRRLTRAAAFTSTCRRGTTAPMVRGALFSFAFLLVACGGDNARPDASVDARLEGFGEPDLVCPAGRIARPRATACSRSARRSGRGRRRASRPTPTRTTTSSTSRRSRTRTATATASSTACGCSAAAARRRR